jgi:GNAT superfamily N-acetyltransferase
MAVVIINEDNRHCFECYAPKYVYGLISEPDTIALGSVDDKTGIAAGLLLAEPFGDALNIVWLYIDDEYREQGRAMQLLKHLILASHDLVMSVTAEFEGDNALYTLFKRIGFINSEAEIPAYPITVSMIAENSFFKEDWNADKVVALSETDEYMLKMFSHNLESFKAGAAVKLPIESAYYEQQISTVYINNNKIEGILLFSNDEYNGDNGFILDFAYAARSEKALLPSLLRRAGRVLCDNYPPHTKITITAINSISSSIVTKLFPKLEPARVFRAELAF